MDILLETHKLLTANPKPLETIAKEAGVGYHWLAKFHQGVIPNPGILHVLRLHKYLSRKNDA